MTGEYVVDLRRVRSRPAVMYFTRCQLIVTVIRKTYTARHPKVQPHEWNENENKRRYAQRDRCSRDEEGDHHANGEPHVGGDT